MEKKLLVKYVDVDIFQLDQLVLKNIQLEIHSGEFIYLLGKVGSGKSSLLKTLYHELPVYTGEAGVLGYDLLTLKNTDEPFLRRKIGIVFQDFQLLTDRNIHQNLEFVLRATGWTDKQAIDEQIKSVLRQVGMPNVEERMPHQLSGGEQQRIVIARALLNSPEMILADEPTGNLDPETGKELIELLDNIRRSGTTIIMATHNLNWIEMFPGRIIHFENDKIVEIQGISNIKTVKIKEIVESEDEKELIIINNEVVDYEYNEGVEDL